MVSRLLRTIVYVIANPNRSLAWKVVDSLFLVALLILVLLVLLNSSADDLGSYFLLLPVIVLITCRSWYSMPRGRRPTVPPSGGKLPPRLAGPGPTGDAPTHTWDPIDDDRVGRALPGAPETRDRWLKLRRSSA